MILSIGFVTARKFPEFRWFFDSLHRQIKTGDAIEIICIDFYAQVCDAWTQADVDRREKEVKDANNGRFQVIWMPPKPTVWSGPNRLPKENWWSTSCFVNTAVCMASGDFFARVDDRQVLADTWMEGVRDAERHKYAACGPYQKRTGITVENGVIKHAGIVVGEDNRLQYVNQHYRYTQKNPYSCPGEWFYGCSNALSMEWVLKLNGWDETCDGSSGEDYIFGLMLQNNDMPIFYDTRMSVIQDRTPEFSACISKGKDKGRSPEDKSHALLARLRGHKRAQHPWDIRTIRTNVQRGMPWPKAEWPVADWYDGEQVKDMTL